MPSLIVFFERCVFLRIADCVTRGHHLPLLPYGPPFLCIVKPSTSMSLKSLRFGNPKVEYMFCVIRLA